MAICTRCRAEIPPGIFTYEGDGGGALCPRCFRSGGGAGERPRGFSLLRGLAIVFRMCAVAGLVGGAAIAHLAPEGERVIPAVGLALGAGVFLGCLAMAELIRLGLSVEESLARLSEAVTRIEESSHDGRDTRHD